MMNDETRFQPQLRIWQQNCRRSLDNMLHVVNSLNPNLFDLCPIQEPHIDFLNRTRAPNGWRTILPPSHSKNNAESEHRTRAAILVSPRLDTSQWRELDIDSPDITGIQIWGDFGTIHIINIYADCEHSRAIWATKAWLRANEHNDDNGNNNDMHTTSNNHERQRNPG